MCKIIYSWEFFLFFNLTNRPSFYSVISSKACFQLMSLGLIQNGSQSIFLMTWYLTWTLHGPKYNWVLDMQCFNTSPNTNVNLRPLRFPEFLPDFSPSLPAIITGTLSLVVQVTCLALSNTKPGHKARDNLLPISSLRSSRVLTNQSRRIKVR